MASVEIADVRKSYGPVPAIRGVSITIADGEFVALVGPSGCGKSTLLQIVAGLEDLTGGTIRIGERVVNDVSPKDRNVAMVFQNYALYPHMTVARNMSFSLRLARLPKAQIAERVERAAKILGISELLDRYPRQLSGGQRQRVAMGRAIVRDPEVFLFDEPLSNLDAKLRVQMRMEIKSLHQRLRTTTIYVTHDQIEAMTMADRIVVMQGGIVEQAGTPMEVYNAPANLFVASFIGSPTINLLPGKVEVDGAGGYRFRSDRGWAIALPDAQALLGRRVVLGLRPEHFVLQPGGTKAQVVLVEPTGSETQLHLRIGEDEVTAAFRDRILPAPGDTLELAWDPRDIHLFDEETGRRLATAGRVIPAMPRPAAQLHVLPVTGRS